MGHAPAPRVALAALVGLVIAALVASCIDQGGSSSRTQSPADGASPRPGTTAAPGPPGTADPASPGATTSGPAPTVPASGTWARVEVNGPAPAAREDHTWTVGEDGRTAYLFGGRDGGTVFDDLWTFDLVAETWQQVAFGGEAPAPRFGHEGIWIPGRGLAIWAGQAGSTFFDDLWLFEPGSASWRLLPAGGQAPVARYGSCSGIGPDGRLWISHGFTEDGARFADTRAYDFEAGAWSDQAPAGEGPIERCLHACWWTSDGRLALYGGQTTGVAALGDLWFLTPGSSGAPSNAWAAAPPPEPPARQLSAVARRSPITVMTGGRGLDREPLADTWIMLDGAAGFVQLDTGGGAPRARSGAAMVYDPAADRFVLFGGLAADALDDLWSLTFP